jgi:ABC-type branched-subunit amino acid transport system substrate-binding protein
MKVLAPPRTYKMQPRRSAKYSIDERPTCTSGDCGCFLTHTLCTNTLLTPITTTSPRLTKCSHFSMRNPTFHAVTTANALLLLLVVVLAAGTAAAFPTSFFPSSTPIAPAGQLYNVTYRDAPVADESSVLRVGVMYSGTGPFSAFGVHTQRLAVSWLNDLLGAGGIVGTTDVAVKLVLCDAGSAPALALLCTTRLIAAGIHIAVSPESTLAVTVMPQFELAQIPVVAPLSTQSFIFICDASLQAPCTRVSQRRFEHLFGTQPLAADLFRDDINVMKVMGAKTVAIVKGSDLFSQEVCQTAEQDAEYAGLSNVYSTTLSATFNATERDQMMADLQARNADLVYYCDRANCTGMLYQFRHQQYYPSRLMTIQCVDYPIRTQADPLGDGELYDMGSMRYVHGATGWDPRVHGPDYEEAATTGYANHFVGSKEIPSPMQFRNYFVALTQNRTGVVLEPTYSHSGIAMAFILIEAAIAQARAANPSVPALTPAHLYGAISRVYMATFNGRMSTDTYGLVRGSAIVRYQVGPNGALEITAPANAQTMPVIYPAPSYTERFFTNPQWGQRVEKVAVALVICAQVYHVLLLVCMFATREHELIRGMSWKFAALTIVGSQLMLFSILTWTINNNDAQCRARIPMIFFGYAAVLCSIFARVYRLHRIFNRSALRSVSYPDGKLALIMMIPFGVMAVLFLISVAAFPLRLEEFSPNASDPYIAIRPSLNYTDCSVGGGAEVILYIMLAASFLLTCTIYYLARRTKHVPAIFNSPLEIVNSLGLFLICISVALALVLSGATKANRSADFGVRSIFVFVACCGSIHGLYFDPIRQAALHVFFGQQPETVGAAPALPANHTILDDEEQPRTPSDHATTRGSNKTKNSVGRMGGTTAAAATHPGSLAASRSKAGTTTAVHPAPSALPFPALPHTTTAYLAPPPPTPSHPHQPMASHNGAPA